MIETSGAQKLYDLLIAAAVGNAEFADPCIERSEDLALNDPKGAADICKAHAAAALPLVQAACTFATSIDSNRQRPPR